MKKLKYTLVLLVGLVIGLASCTKVDILPETKPITSTKAGKNKLMIATPEPMPIIKEDLNK